MTRSGSYNPPRLNERDQGATKQHSTYRAAGRWACSGVFGGEPAGSLASEAVCPGRPDLPLDVRCVLDSTETEDQALGLVDYCCAGLRRDSAPACSGHRSV